MNAGTHRSLWLATAPVRSYPKLEADIRTEIAVVGGGMVGVLTASRLARSGREVVLLDGMKVLGGVTGNTTAKVTAAHGSIYNHIDGQFSTESAALYARANSEAIAWIEQTAAERGIDCDFRRKPLYIYAEKPEGFSDLEKEAQAATRAGLPYELVQRLDINFETHGALLVPNQAEFHPLKFLKPFLEDLGESIYEGTMVQEVDEKEVVTLTTIDGRKIVADYVVIATHFPFFDPGFYYTRLNPFRDYAIAVALDESVPSAMYVAAGDGYTYRSQPAEGGEVLIVSGGNHKVGKGGDTRQHYADMEEHTRRNFRVREVPYAWSTQDVETLDKVPYVGRISANAERVFVATGFGGWGMTNSVVASELIANLIQGNDHPLEDLYSPLRFKPLTSAPTLFEVAKDSVQGLIGERLHKAADRTAAELSPGEADVLQTDDGKVAVYKDDSGQVHAVSPVCTHMGCILEWNSAEKSWDCPCHGSRFGFDGDVLHGPAVQPLDPKQV